jgi:hypothetical protein
MTRMADGLWCSDAVRGSAARHILAGDLPDGDRNCCRVARSHRRMCWHMAAAILLANGLRPAARPGEHDGVHATLYD